jgi:Uma2 family endonuclease
MYQNNPAIPVNALPTMYDLPSEDPEEMGLPDEFHDTQPDLLKETCRPAADKFFMGADLNLYYDVEHTGWYKRPDYFLVIGVPASTSPQDGRQSYVVWQEGVNPFLMVELLSPGTEAEDLGQTLRVVGKPPTKWQVYEQVLQVPYYAVFDEFSGRFRMFCLRDGQYVESTISGQGFWLPERSSDVKFVNFLISRGNSDKYIPDKSSFSHCSCAAWVIKERTDRFFIRDFQRRFIYSDISGLQANVLT